MEQGTAKSRDQLDAKGMVNDRTCPKRQKGHTNRRSPTARTPAPSVWSWPPGETTVSVSNPRSCTATRMDFVIRGVDVRLNS